MVGFKFWALWHLSDDPYHTELVAWHEKHFSLLFRFVGSVGSWQWKIPLFFFNPSLNVLFFFWTPFYFSYPLLQFFEISCFDKIFAGLSWISAEHGSIGWVCHHPFEASPVINLLDSPVINLGASPVINLVGSPVNLVSAPAPCVLKSSMRRARSRIWIVWWRCKLSGQSSYQWFVRGGSVSWEVMRQSK